MVTAFFAAGMFVGAYFSSLLFAPRFALESFVEAAEIQTPLKYLSENDNEKAHSYLIMKEDASVLSLDSQMPYMANEMKQKTCNLFDQIYKRRTENIQPPPIYSNPEAEKEVLRILTNREACGIE